MDNCVIWCATGSDVILTVDRGLTHEAQKVLATLAAIADRDEINL